VRCTGSPRSPGRAGSGLNCVTGDLRGFSSCCAPLDPDQIWPEVMEESADPECRSRFPSAVRTAARWGVDITPFNASVILASGNSTRTGAGQRRGGHAGSAYRGLRRRGFRTPSRDARLPPGCPTCCQGGRRRRCCGRRRPAIRVVAFRAGKIITTRAPAAQAGRSGATTWPPRAS
jgi:hypothetical protein